MDLKQKMNTLGCIFLVLTGLCLPLSIAGYNLTVGLLTLCVLLSGHWQEKWQLLKNQRTLWLLLLLVLMFAAGLFYSSADWPRRLYILKSYYKLLYIPFIVMLNPSMKWRLYALGAFVVANVFIAIVAIVQVVGHLKYAGDPTGIFHNHIGTSLELTMAMFICFMATLSCKKYRWLFFTLSILFLVVILFFNNGRTGLIALVLGFIYLTLRHSNWRAALAMLGFIILALFLIVKFDLGLGKYIKIAGDNGLKIASSVAQAGDYQTASSSTNIRVTFWRHSAHLIKAKPILGHGTGSFKNEYFKNFGYPAWGSVKAGQPNNTYLIIAVQLGLVGLLMYLAFLFSLWLDAKGKKRHVNTYELMLVGFAVGCLTESFVRLTVGGFFFVFLAGLIIVAKNQEKIST